MAAKAVYWWSGEREPCMALLNIENDFQGGNRAVIKCLNG